MPISEEQAVKVLIVFNPKSGSGSPGLFDYVQELGEAGAEVTIRYFNGSLEPTLRDAASFDRIVAAGGDGTVSSIAYALRDTGIPIVAYPAGTANLLALNLRMPNGAKALANVTLTGQAQRTDLAELHLVRPDGSTYDQGFAIMAGAGFDASIMHSAVDLKPVLGAGAYFVAAFQHLQPTVAEFTLEVDGEVIRTDGIAVVLINFARITFDLCVTHESDAHDGRLEVAVIRARDAGQLLPVVWAALLDRIGHHPDRSPGMDVYTGSSIRVSAEPRLPLQADGDTIDTMTPFSADVLAGAATFVVPNRT